MANLNSKTVIKPEANPYEGRFGLVLARVSSKKQELDGNGRESQAARCVSKLNSLGITVEKVFAYTQSGGSEFADRKDIQAILEYIDANPQKNYVLAFDDLSRFARNTAVHIRLRMEFRNRDVLLVSPNFNFDDSEEGEFVETVLAGAGQLGRKQNRKQVIQKQAARLEAGYWAFGRKKGYDMVKDPVHGKIGIPNKIGLEVFKPALEGFFNGTFIRKIDAIRFIQSKGAWTKQRAEKYIDKFTQMLKDPYYAGFIEYTHPPLWNVKRRPGHHQALIMPEVFEGNQRRLRKVDLGQRVRVDTSPDFPLRGLIIHDLCKGHITGAWYPNGKGSKYRRLVCHTPGCPLYNKPFDADEPEKKFMELLEKGALKGEVDILLKKMFDRVWQDEMEQVRQSQVGREHEIKVLGNKISELTNLSVAAKSARVRSVYEQQIESTSKEIEELEAKSLDGIDMSIPYQTAFEKASLLLKKPAVAWKKLNVHEQHGLYFFLFQEKIPYSITEGYQTHEIPYAARLFEDFVEQKHPMVEMGRVKLPSKTNSSSHYSQD